MILMLMKIIYKTVNVLGKSESVKVFKKIYLAKIFKIFKIFCQH